jgi:Na+-driven multidrug efflux pump
VRATGAVLPPLAILSVSLLCVRFPFAVLLMDRYDADAIWWSFPTSSIVALALSVAYYRYGNWRSARMGSASPPPPTPPRTESAAEAPP